MVLLIAAPSNAAFRLKRKLERLFLRYFSTNLVLTHHLVCLDEAPNRYPLTERRCHRLTAA